MHECRKCVELGLRFCRPYLPNGFIEGDAHSPIWIIGINPKERVDWIDTRSEDDLRDGFAELASKHGYFRKFRDVSERLFARIGKPNGVAHTDLVKCSSLSWPPKGASALTARQIVANCAEFLRMQIVQFKPRLLLCNGSDVCRFIRTVVQPVAIPACATSYRGRVDGHEIDVVLSGFIGRIDNFAKRRLGQEIERIADELGLLG